jgi:CRISPR-associated protein Cas1
MSTLYLKEQGAVLRRTGERLVVTKDREVLEDVPIIHIDQVVVMGNIQLTTPVVSLLLQRDVDVVFLSSRGRFRGRLESTGSRFGQLRHAQLRLLDDEAAVLAIAQAAVDGKLHNQRHTLQSQGNRRAVKQSVGEIERARRQARSARNLDTLRGYEGAAGAAYFRALQALIPPEWGFVKRLYHPPPDPVNALLSLGYTLLLKDTIAAVQLVGLDPYLGFFHSLDYGRPSLALDLMEPFRPVVDDMVLGMIESRRIQRKDFREERRKNGHAVLLEEQALRRYLETYEARMVQRVRYPGTGEHTARRRCLELQTRELAQVVLGKRKRFDPFLME